MRRPDRSEKVSSEDVFGVNRRRPDNSNEVRSENVYYVVSIFSQTNSFTGESLPTQYTVMELPPDSPDLRRLQELDAAINKDVEYPSKEYDNLNAERDEILQNLREQDHNEYRFSSEKLYFRGLTLTLNELPENKQLLEPGKEEQKKQKSTG